MNSLTWQRRSVCLRRTSPILSAGRWSGTGKSETSYACCFWDSSPRFDSHKPVTVTVTIYTVCAEAMLVRDCLRGRPGGLGLRSRPTAPLGLSMNSWLPNGVPRRVASLSGCVPSMPPPLYHVATLPSSALRCNAHPIARNPATRPCRPAGSEGLPWTIGIPRPQPPTPPAGDSAPRRPTPLLHVSKNGNTRAVPTNP